MEPVLKSRYHIIEEATRGERERIMIVICDLGIGRYESVRNRVRGARTMVHPRVNLYLRVVQAFKHVKDILGIYGESAGHFQR